MLEEVKAWLNFTWEDPAREKEIEFYINSSIQFFNEFAGEEIDFDTDLVARELLFYRVLYADSKCLNDFENNYISELTDLKNRYLVKNNE